MEITNKRIERIESNITELYEDLLDATDSLSCREAGRMMGIDHATVHKMRVGKRRITIEFIFRASKYFVNLGERVNGHSGRKT